MCVPSLCERFKSWISSSTRGLQTPSHALRYPASTTSQPQCIDLIDWSRRVVAGAYFWKSSENGSLKSCVPVAIPQKNVVRKTAATHCHSRGKLYSPSPTLMISQSSESVVITNTDQGATEIKSRLDGVRAGTNLPVESRRHLPSHKIRGLSGPCEIHPILWVWGMARKRTGSRS